MQHPCVVYSGNGNCYNMYINTPTLVVYVSFSLIIVPRIGGVFKHHRRGGSLFASLWLNVWSFSHMNIVYYLRQK